MFIMKEQLRNNAKEHTTETQTSKCLYLETDIWILERLIVDQQPRTESCMTATHLKNPFKNLQNVQKKVLLSVMKGQK